MWQKLEKSKPVRRFIQMVNGLITAKAFCKRLRKFTLLQKINTKVCA